MTAYADNKGIGVFGKTGRRIFQIGLPVVLLMFMTGLPAWAGPDEDLSVAAFDGNISGVRAALAAGADVNRADTNGEPPSCWPPTMVTPRW